MSRQVGSTELHQYVNFKQTKDPSLSVTEGHGMDIAFKETVRQAKAKEIQNLPATGTFSGAHVFTASMTILSATSILMTGNGESRGLSATRVTSTWAAKAPLFVGRSRYWESVGIRKVSFIFRWYVSLSVYIRPLIKVEMHELHHLRFWAISVQRFAILMNHITSRWVHNEEKSET